MDDPPESPRGLDALFVTFTVKEILTLVGAIVRLPRSAKRNRSTLFECLESFPETTRDEIRAAALQATGTKRKAKDGGGQRKRRRLDTDIQASAVEHYGPVDDMEGIIEGPFLVPPSEEEQRACVQRAIDRTGNAVLTKHICMVCARLLFAELLERMSVAAIPNKRHLIPSTPHPAHKLVNGWLLHEEAAAVGTTYLCLDCKRKLEMDERPAFALSNGIWIGSVPFQLKVLGLAERILVALYFPAVYIIKLYPKKKGARFWNKDKLNSGLRGNVSTYRLNTAHITDLVAGTPRTMPPSAKILAATIGVTFVGVGNRPLAELPGFLRVRRQRVFDALLWLKQNNPIYSDVNISEDRLRALPEDAVPEEIAAGARYSEDVASLERESTGYVPMDVADEANEEDDFNDITMGTVGAAAGVLPTEVDGEQPEGEDHSEADSFHLQALGVIDVHGNGVEDGDVYAHGFANAADHRRPNNFKIRRDSAFVNEYPRRDAFGTRTDGGPENPNHLLGAFPVLFPYGKGGFEVDRDVEVPYEAHVRWALQYADSRFRKDLYFIFQAFGVIQKREVCRSAGLQVKRSAFIANQVAFMKLSPKDLLKASAEEKRRVPYSNSTVRKLRKHLTSVRSRVAGTDESRIAVRSQIWGMNLRFNPPSIWATINLADTSDPIAQVLTGAHIDLDRFVDTAGPTKDERAINVAADPYAAAEFFHYTINMLLKEVFGIDASKRGRPGRKRGVVGLVNGYIGMVEAQGRGTLHLHILFWLAGAPSSVAMHDALTSEAFRAKVVHFIKNTIRADIKGKDAAAVGAMKKTSAVAYSRPADPRQPNYELRRHETEAKVARTVQFHDCSIAACLVNKKGRWVCKRRAPFPLASDDWVLPSGEWGPRRVCGRLNAWNPTVLQVIRANQDMKLITNGHETKDIAFYITLYIAKKQIQASNASALLAKSLAFHRKMDRNLRDCKDLNKRMLQQCANTLSRQQELSGPEVVGYLMGWGDRFISHTFVKIHWDEMTNALRRAYPQLERKNVLYRAATQSGASPPPQAFPSPPDPEVRLQMVDGVFVLKDQLKEYTDRGVELEDMNMHDYFADTYHGNVLKAASREGDDDEENEGRVAKRSGRPASKRFAYHPASKRQGCRILRGPNYETVVQFIGSWFPRADAGDYYLASMLMLVKPWRKLGDLLPAGTSFKQEFDKVMAGASSRVKTLVANVAYYHECSDGSKRQKDTILGRTDAVVDINDYIRRDQELAELEDLAQELTEDDVQSARDARQQYRDTLYGMHAMAVAEEVGVFDGENLQGSGPFQRQASMAELVKYGEWGKKVASMTRKDLLKTSNVIDMPIEDVDLAQVRVPGPASGAVIADDPPESRNIRSAVQQAALDLLNVEQRRAHDIIEQHARRTLAGCAQEQLLMIVRGEGGTGKTVLLTAIAHTFDFLNASDMLAKTATTGVAASLVGGQTLHSWAAIPIRKANVDPGGPVSSAAPATVEKRKRNILPARYLDIDECSMLTKKVLAKLSQIVGEVRDAGGIGDPTKPFGGLNVVLFGDFHQFPPVADSKGALYCRDNSNTEAELGLDIYRQFKTVVTLTEQKRITDLPWKELLQRLRYGACTEADVDVLRSLLVTQPGADIPQWEQWPWNQAVLVTPRHAVRNVWNTAALQKHCKRTSQRMYICPAEDTLGREEGDLTLEQRVLVAGMTLAQTGKLEDRVELAMGMRAMVLTNIATEADLANGTRGEVVDFVLDPREPTEMETDKRTGAVLLKYPPAVVLFKPDKCDFPPFEGLPAGVLPIVPSKGTFTIETSDRQRHQIHRFQLAMTPGYAFTDYKSQGQTLEYVIIDLESPPGFQLTPFSAYVALSRSRGRDRIRLLRGFEDSLFTTHPSEHLADEDDRLDALTAETRKRRAG